MADTADGHNDGQVSPNFAGHTQTHTGCVSANAVPSARHSYCHREIMHQQSHCYNISKVTVQFTYDDLVRRYRASDSRLV
jgi:hypothetical protein